MAEHVLVVSARDIIHHCGGPGGLMALVAIQVCGYQLLRRNDKGDFERNCSGVIGGTDDLLLAPTTYHRPNKVGAVRMVFKTLWEAQADLPQAFRSVTSVQLLKAANEKHSSNFATPLNNANVTNAMSGRKATFKKNPDALGSYIPN
jgi:hypothetical protein